MCSASLVGGLWFPSRVLALLQAANWYVVLSTGLKLALGRLGGLHGTVSGRIWESIFKDPCNLMCILGISSFLKDLCNEKHIFEVLGGLDVDLGMVIRQMVFSFIELLP